MTQQIIVDSCGWVAIIDSGLNFESELERIFGKFSLILTTSVEDELSKLEQSRPRKILVAKSIKAKVYNT